MKTNTKILVALLLISVVGNALFVANPENASKVHNMTLSKDISSKTAEKFFEVKIEEEAVEPYRDKWGHRNGDLYMIGVNAKNISNFPREINANDFCLVDEKECVYLPNFEYQKLGYFAFSTVSLNPGTSNQLSLSFVVPTDKGKKYTLCTYKDYIKLITSKDSKK